MSVVRARELRKTLTRQEAVLWKHLRDWRPLGFHIRRQAPFRGYVLDFVCFDRRLVVEIDGEQHSLAEGARHDVVRDAVLEREGFLTLRFTNRQVNEDLKSVLDAIFQALARRTPTPRG